jgi:hypothetical protein
MKRTSMRFEIKHFLQGQRFIDYRKKETKKAGPLLTLPLLFQN